MGEGKKRTNQEPIMPFKRSRIAPKGDKWCGACTDIGSTLLGLKTKDFKYLTLIVIYSNLCKHGE